MPQVPVIPAKRSPQPSKNGTTANQRLTSSVRTEPIADSVPTTIWTWRIKGRTSLFPRLTESPASIHACVPPSTRNAVEAAAALESLNGLLGPGACLAKDIDGLARLVPLQKGFDVQVIQGDEPCAGNMGIDKFRRCANIEQFHGAAG